MFFDAPPLSPCRNDKVSDVQLNDSELLEAVKGLIKVVKDNFIRTSDHHLNVMITRQNQFIIFLIMLSWNAFIVSIF